MIESKALIPIKAKVSKLENKANAVVVETKEGYAEAIDIVSGLKEAGSQIKTIKESITKPLNESLRNARAVFSPLEKQYKDAGAMVKGKLLTYKQKIDEEARIKEEKIANRVESGNIKLETGERKMDEIERVEKTTRGKVGSVQVRKVKKVMIDSEALVPREYLVPDMVKIRRDALSGIKIAGVRVYEEETLAVGS